MPDLLAEIYRDRRRHLRAEIAAEPLPELQARASRTVSGRRSLTRALARANPPALIAEIKRASPSAGQIAPEIDPGEVASSYQAAGADAISVLTEPDRFLGRLDDLAAVRVRSELPILRKDFLSTDYQVVQSAAYGADAILAIVAGLGDRRLGGLLAEARKWSLDVLVEVHSAAELARALALGADLVGINNRDLRSLRIDESVTQDLIPLVPAGVRVVSESGFARPEQLERLHGLGVGAFLVGEALMRATDRAALVAQLKAATGAPA
ncbi:MAG: indole-3-glycerol phosphate synthase TrpC [Candidatus Dormibacteria bacterium]